MAKTQGFYVCVNIFSLLELSIYIAMIVPLKNAVTLAATPSIA